jgi:hypothetical protein
MRSRAFVAVLLVAGSAGLARAQTQPPPLAEVARVEEARRNAAHTPGKVYTNDDLKPDFTKPLPPPPPPGAAPGTEAAAPGEAPAAGTPAPPATPTNASGAVEKQNAEGYWRNRMAEARAQLERSQTFAQALQNRVDGLWTDFVNRDNPIERAAIEQDRIKALDELARTKKDVEDNQKAVRAIEEEARRANVPPGWLRP